jgi:quercetin dioxygenase-like cupin family protein
MPLSAIQRKTMKFKALTLLSSVALLSWAFAGESPQPAVVQIDHDKVTAAFAKGGLLAEGGNYKVQAGRREGPGQAEIHERDTDIFYVLDGTATFVTGGQAVGMTNLSAGELRGREITGGETHHLTKGDVITIPNGVPHWFKETSKPFLYLMVKVTK